MIRFLILLRLKQTLKQPLKNIAYFVFLLYVAINLYGLSLFFDNLPLNSDELTTLLSLSPLIVVLLSDFLFGYKMNLFLMPVIYPVSDLKNAVLSFVNEFFQFTYLVVLTILFGLIFLFKYSYIDFIGISLLLLSISVFKFSLRYLLKTANKKSVLLFVSILPLFSMQLFIFLNRLPIEFQALLSFIHLVIYRTNFKYLRQDFFSVKKLNVNKHTNRIAWVLYYGMKNYANLFYMFFVVKIGFILLFSVYYKTTGNVLISPFAQMIVLSPIFLFTYFHNNFVVLNLKIYKNLSLAWNKYSIVLFHLFIVFSTLLIDALLSIPAFIVFGYEYLYEYIILFFTFLLSSVFISFYFPKEKTNTDLWLKGTTSKAGVILFFLYIGWVSLPLNNYLLKLIPLFISSVLLLISLFYFDKKYNSICNGI